MIFPPKGSLPDDTTRPIRAPEDTRPLNCKNCDNKAIAGATNCTLSQPLAKMASASQRGFVPGRQGIVNVIELETISRIIDLSPAPGALPLSILWDFAAAFPSLAHEFLFIVLSYVLAPFGLISLILALSPICQPTRQPAARLFGSSPSPRGFCKAAPCLARCLS